MNRHYVSIRNRSSLNLLALAGSLLARPTGPAGRLETFPTGLEV
jgi:hypothetical protein